MVEIENVYKKFGNVDVLKGVSFQVKKGEVSVILGKSGSGKTTLLRSINFLERADSGILRIGDKTVDFSKASSKDISEIRKRVAFVFQGYSLFQNKTALENVTLGLTLGQKMPKKKAIEIGKSMLDKVGMSERYYYYPHQLSGGQQQRVSIARAIAINPEIILLDEPTSALDPQLTGEILTLLKQIAAEGTTMLIVTHELGFTREVADNVIFMDQGVVVEQNQTKEFFTHPKSPVTQAFLRGFTTDFDFSI